MYETPYTLTDQLLKSDYHIVSDYLNIKSNNSNLNSDFSIYFNQNSIIGDYYDLEKIKVSKDGEQIITFPSYLEDDYITAKVNQFGKYMLTYNVNPASDDIAIPQTFGIKSYNNEVIPTILVPPLYPLFLYSVKMISSDSLFIISISRIFSVVVFVVKKC